MTGCNINLKSHILPDLTHLPYLGSSVDGRFSRSLDRYFPPAFNSSTNSLVVCTQCSAERESGTMFDLCHPSLHDNSSLSHFLLRSKLDLAMKPSYATGAALPNEIIAIIVTSFLSKSIPGEIPLGTLSLVCRFWAKKLRRRIFSTLEIRSRNAFKQLLELLQNPGPVQPSISQCIFMVRLRQEGLWGDPWLHHVQAELSKHVACQIPFYITLENTSTPYHQESSIAMYAPSTFSAALPRTLPSACFPFQSLYLNDLRFRRILDLLRLIDLAHLQSLWLKNIAIEQTTDWVPGIRRRRPDVAGVYVSRSGAVEHELKIASYLLWHTRKGYPLDFSTWNILRDITISWLPPALTDIHVGMDTSADGKRCG